MNTASESLKPYLTYSLAAHVGSAALVLGLYGISRAKSSKVYMIDFVGPSATIISAGAEAVAPAAGSAAVLQPQSDPDEFSARRNKGAALPRPSLLRGWREPSIPEPPAAAPAPQTAGAPGQAGVATDLPNFPYPWYISQLRQALWDQWSGRMPKGAGECVVVFSLLPNGRFVDLRIEESSGDPAFDLAAQSAVQDGAPYPPLPKGFKEPFLKIHLTLKSL
ncbi:MAG: TonB C-terminal domain-containing protein [Elusimicrobia bacterium]|nr:TonB C-terminal domain-containing protein [Elusimicrobiota bacterium]